MGKQKEDAEEPQAVDSDYSGRPLEDLTPEGVRESLASGRVRRRDREVMVDADGTRWDALTGEKLPPRKPS